MNHDSNGTIDQSNFAEISLPDSYGRPQPAYLLDFKATLTLVTGYDSVRRGKVIDRWLTLETGKATPAYQQQKSAPWRSIGEPWFVARDVCEVLGYSNHNSAVSRHCRGVANHYPIRDKLGRTQNARVIREPDVYRLISGSTLKSAVAFEAWLYEEVLPSIRKTGSYSAKLEPANVHPVGSLDAMVNDLAEMIASTVVQRIEQKLNPLMSYSPDTGVIEVVPEEKPVAPPQKVDTGGTEYRLPDDMLRAQCRQLVKTIQAGSCLSHQDVWNIAYKRLNEKCRCNIKRVKSNRKLASTIDAVEQTGRMHALYTVLEDMRKSTSPFSHDF